MVYPRNVLLLLYAELVHLRHKPLFCLVHPRHHLTLRFLIFLIHPLYFLPVVLFRLFNRVSVVLLDLPQTQLVVLFCQFRLQLLLKAFPQPVDYFFGFPDHQLYLLLDGEEKILGVVVGVGEVERRALREMAIVFEESEILGLRLELPHLFSQVLDFLLDDVILLRVAGLLLALGTVGRPRLSLLLDRLLVVLEDYHVELAFLHQLASIFLNYAALTAQSPRLCPKTPKSLF